MPDFSKIVLPYFLYTDDDIAHRVLYVEASRGCPFTCEFCLSSLDIPVRQVPLPSFIESLQDLLNRGAKQFKFVDRTFNLNVSSSKAILEFLLERYQPGHFYHFEMIPDRLPDALRDIIAKFPPGALQFEVGVQTFNEEIDGPDGQVAYNQHNIERACQVDHFLHWLGVGCFVLTLMVLTIFLALFGLDRMVATGPIEALLLAAKPFLTFLSAGLPALGAASRPARRWKADRPPTSTVRS